jgi:A/G-specific adenine glycosylase
MSAFAKKIIVWQKNEGRHDLPWQNTRDPYRIWLSEVMLQQTQVAAVVPYYERFLVRFPDFATLAAASLDEVMPFWAGLGYYARARNLHRGAQQIMAVHGGVFPKEFDAIHSLSGIGRSTAAAISAFAFGERRAILDGNVKRVFARHFCVEGDVKSKSVEEQLWLLAEAQLPRTEIESYTQGLMDLGATLCKRSRPDCQHCPVKKSCVALEQGKVEMLPGKSKTRELPHRQTRMLVIISSGEVLLEKRPPAGIWGGLWSLPELPVDADMFKTLQARYGLKSRASREMPQVNHSFTHFSLAIFPIEITPAKIPLRAMQPGLIWLNLDDAVNAAIPAPVKRILKSVCSNFQRIHIDEPFHGA